MACAVPGSTSMCSACRCVAGGRSCDICIHFNFNCRGTCLCCAGRRRLFQSLPSTSKSEGPSSLKTLDPKPLCTQCECLKNSKYCRKCARGNFKCTGTCPCCANSRKNVKITVDETILDNIISNSVMTTVQCNDGTILLIPLETYNALSKASDQPFPSPRKIQFRKPPSRPAPTSPAKPRTILCAICYCEADRVPCEVCVKGTRCRDSCPCCNEKDRQRFLNPHPGQKYEPMCPRCTRTPGEGVCVSCRRTAEARFKTRRGRPTIPAFLKKKKKRIPAILKKKTKSQPKDADRPEDVKEKKETKSVLVGNDIKLQPYNIKDEYCLHCECTHGTEPCDHCKKAPCYGDCNCCKEFNLQLLKRNLMENLPDNCEIKEHRSEDEC